MTLQLKGPQMISNVHFYLAQRIILKEFYQGFLKSTVYSPFELFFEILL